MLRLIVACCRTFPDVKLQAPAFLLAWMQETIQGISVVPQDALASP